MSGGVESEVKKQRAWPMVRLGDVCEFYRGLTYKKTDEVSFSDKIVLRSNNVSLESGVLDFTELKFLRTDFLIPSEKVVQKDSILMCMANGSKIHLGKVALVTEDFGYAFGGFMGLLVPKGVAPKYLYLSLLSERFKDLIKELQNGANINNLKFADISDFEFPLPPLSVQKEIVERLEKELGEADKVAANFKKMVELADAEFKAELDETFKALENGEGGCFNTEAQRVWPMVRIGDVCEVVLGGTPSTKIEAYWGGDVFWLTPSDMGKIDGVYVDKTSRTITKEGLLKGSSLFPAYSVIVSTRAPIGYVLINTVPMCTNQGCKTLVPRESLDAKYLCFNLLGRKEELNELGTGTTFRELSTGNLKSIKISLPPLSVQKEIVERLEKELGEIEKLKAAAERGLRAAENLRKAILSEAFE